MKREFRRNDFVWFEGQGWLFDGMDEDGDYSLVRPVEGHVFNVIEYETVGVAEFEEFCKANGVEYKAQLNLVKNVVGV
jgi:hypothetical protein